MNGQREAWDALYSTQGRPWRGVTEISWTGVTPGMKVLDLGCGNGKTSEALLDIGAEVTGIDFSQPAVDSCINRFGDMARFVCGDVCKLPFDDNGFDAVFAFHVLEHLTEPELETAVSEIGRVLRPGGRVCLKCFAEGDMRSEGKAESVRNGILYRYLTEEQVRSVFSDFDMGSFMPVTEKTRFGTYRKRFECVFFKSTSA